MCWVGFWGPFGWLLLVQPLSSGCKHASGHRVITTSSGSHSRGGKCFWIEKLAQTKRPNSLHCMKPVRKLLSSQSVDCTAELVYTSITSLIPPTQHSVVREYCFQLCPFVTLTVCLFAVWMSVNTTPKPLEVSSWNFPTHHPKGQKRGCVQKWLYRVCGYWFNVWCSIV